MKERPIIFSGPMVRAILDGQKTQTRRVVKPQPSCISPSPSVGVGVWHNAPNADGSPGRDWCWTTYGVAREWVRCPYGKPGDLLWVRETWRPFMEGYRSGIEYRARGEQAMCGDDFERICKYIKQRGGDLRFGGARKELINRHWRPSIHMPRWACRFRLRVTNVRVQRVQDISEEDTRAEGTAKRGDGKWHGRLDGEGRDRRDEYGWYTPWSDTRHNAPAHAFRSAWNHINAKRGHSWESNPWVWAVTFEVQP